MPDKKDEPLDLFQTAKQKGLAVHTPPVTTKLLVNEQGYRELVDKVRRKLDRMDSEARLYFLHDVYQDHLIYEVHDRDQETGRHFRQNYSVNDTGEVTFEGDPVEVRKEIEFVEMTNNAMKRTKFNNQTDNPNTNTTTMEKEKAPCGECMEKVVGLINNERTRFTKADREWLLSLNEEQLEKLEPTQPEPVQVNREQALEALKEDLSTPDTLLGILPEDMKEQIQAGLALHKEERTKLIKAIQTNTEKETWSEDELSGMDMGMLRKIEKSVRRTDFSGQGGTEVQANQGQENPEFMAPAGIEVE